MSTESDSVKSGLSEANDKDASNENHTDESSQDSVSVVEQQKNQNDSENNLVIKNAKIDEEEKEKASEENDEEKTEEKPSVEEPKKLNDTDNKTTDVEEEKVEEEGIDKKSDKTEQENADIKEVIKNDNKIDGKTEEKPEIDEAQKNEVNKDNNEQQPSTASEEDVEEPKNNVPLLDQPLETTGKRERKNVQRFEEDTTKTKEPAKIEFEDGTGTILSEIPRVEASITRFKNDDLKFLHRLLFNVQGNKNLFKKNIRKFNGFAFKKDSEEYAAKVEFLKKNDIKTLKTTCEILDLVKTGTKDDLIDRILDFLVEPKDTSKPTSGGRPKRATAVRANNRGYSSHDDYSSDERHASRVRRDKGKRSNLKDDTSSDEEFKPGDVSDASDEKPKKRKRGRTKRKNAAEGSSEEDEASLTEATSDESDDVPKTKRRKSISKSSNNKGNKTPGRRGRPGRAAAVSQRSRGSKRGRKTTKEETSEDEEEEKFDENSSSEDEPLAKKKTKASEPPSDDEIKTFIKNVLEGANLEEITMKNVCQRVYDNYPDFDLTSRKNFIKSTVKSLIST